MSAKTDIILILVTILHFCELTVCGKLTFNFFFINFILNFCQYIEFGNNADKFVCKVLYPVSL